MYGSFGISKYRSAKVIIEGIKEGQKESLSDLQESIEESLKKAEDRSRKTMEGSESISKAARSTLLMNELTPLDEREAQQIRVAHALGGDQNFIHVYANLAQGIRMAWRMLSDIAIRLETDELFGSDEKASSSREHMHDLSAEYSLNHQHCESFSDGCMKLAEFRWQLLEMCQQISNVVEKYSEALTERHSAGGIKVYHAPVLTDFAMAIYDNVAHHGEISKTSDDTEISAYSLRKAEAIIDWIKDEEFKEILLSETSSFTRRIKGELWDVWKVAARLERTFQKEIDGVAALHHKGVRPAPERSFDQRMAALEDVDPNQVKYRDRSASMTEEERHELQFKNEVIGKICRMLQDDTPAHKISASVWDEVKKLKSHFLEVNSFYICRISQGSQTSGKSNGQLEVIPGKKPTAAFDDIVGSGFNEVKEFVRHIERLRKWAPLYRITSPRKQTDKANILLIGPMGCGKTECMRAICNEEECIAIFAAGSDFLTAWMGEAQKNPKRLFEAAVKLQKESGRHVHILIDEIDEVLNNDRSTTTINLSLEFQMVMDGITEYPGISVWGATNNPERIPMPMIRRFSKVVIVGKLDQDQRVTLLKQFLGTLPLSTRFTKDTWQRFAKRLEHATGDVVRKVCDHVWREEVSRFIEESPEDAERMLSVLEKLAYDRKAGMTPDVLETKRADEEISEGYRDDKKTSRRKKFLKSFRDVFEIQPDIVDEAITLALDNVGIIAEIETAKKTYEDAEKFLASVKENRIKAEKAAEEEDEEEGDEEGDDGENQEAS